MKIAFVIGTFPATSMPWMINWVADLLDRGLDIDVYAFGAEDAKNVSKRYKKYNLLARTFYIGMPENRILRIIKAIPKIVRLLFIAPKMLVATLNIKKYGKYALSLKLLFWSERFVGKKYDLIHLFEGHVANRFLNIKDIIGMKAKIITSLLGYDVSGYIKQHSP